MEEEKVSVIRRLVVWGFVLGIVGLLVAVVGLIYLVSDLPKLKSVTDYEPPLVTEILANDGRRIGEFYKERRYILASDEIPQIIKDAFVSAEDDRFFEHIGIDFQGIIRAAIANIKAGRVVQGGSTITQQVAKSILLSSERSFERKFKEAILASQMEQNLTKDEILFLYLNQIYLGHGAHGIAAATQNYFNKEVKDITIAEAALLAGLAQAPTKYSPLNNSSLARRRQEYVLKRMLETGKINEEQYNIALKDDIRLFDRANLNLEVAPYYVEKVRQDLMAKYGEEMLYTGGLKVTVAADFDLSKKARNSIRENLLELSKRQGYHGPIQRINGKDKEEMLAFLKSVQLELYTEKFPFLFMPLGSDERYSGDAWKLFSYEKAKELELFSSDRDLLSVGQKCKAVVTKIDKDRRTAFVLIGSVRAKMDVSTMRWARRVREGEFSGGSQITYITEAVRVGDIIQVDVLRIPEIKEVAEGKTKTDSQLEAEMVQVTLTQDWTSQSALLSMEANTGKVVAMVGGRDFEESEYNRVLQGARQPGSAFKPFVYAAAIDKGYNPASIIIDSPIIFENQGSQDLKWIPENHGQRYYGDTTLRMALVRSRNVPTVKLLQDIKIPYLIDYVKNLGITEGLNPDLSLALGSNAISLIDLAKIYAIFPRNGLRIEPVYILSIKDRKGELLYEHKQEDMEAAVAERWLAKREAQGGPTDAVTDLATATEVEPEKDPAVNPDEEVASDSGDDSNLDASAKMESEVQKKKDSLKAPTFDDPMRAMEEKTAYIMTDLLQQVITDPGGTGRRARAIKKRVGGKTGTTNDFVDAWFMGFSPELVTGVWTGYDTPKTMGPGETGSRAALPAWVDFMQAATKVYSRDEYTVPKGIVFVRINPEDGTLASANDPRAVKVAFIEGTEPSVKLKDSQVPDSSDFFKEDF